MIHLCRCEHHYRLWMYTRHCVMHYLLVRFIQPWQNYEVKHTLLKVANQTTFMHLSYPLILYLCMYEYIYIYIESKIHVRYWQLALSVWREYKYTILNITVHILGIWSCRVWGIRTVALVPVPGQDAQHHTHNKCKVFICSYTYYIQNETKYCVFMIYTCMPACMLQTLQQ